MWIPYQMQQCSIIWSIWAPSYFYKKHTKKVPVIYSQFENNLRYFKNFKSSIFFVFSFQIWFDFLGNSRKLQIFKIIAKGSPQSASFDFNSSTYTQRTLCLNFQKTRFRKYKWIFPIGISILALVGMKWRHLLIFLLMTNKTDKCWYSSKLCNITNFRNLLKILLWYLFCNGENFELWFGFSLEQLYFYSFCFIMGKRDHT